jgi:hypothetical protein
LKEIILRGHKELKIEIGEEYLIYVKMVALEKGKMWGEIVRIKPLNECWDRS